MKLAVISGGIVESDVNLLSLFLPNSECQQRIIWLLVKYVSYVWNTVHVRESKVSVDKFFGYLRWKFKNEMSHPEISKLGNWLL